MKKLFLPLAIATLTASASNAFAAPVATLTCTAESRQVAVDLSSFDFGAPANGGTAAGLQLLNVHVAASQLGAFGEPAKGKISSCTLRATLDDGTRAQIVLSGISLNSVATAAQPARNLPGRYTEATFQFEKLRIVSAGASDGEVTQNAAYESSTVGATPISVAQ